MAAHATRFRRLQKKRPLNPTGLHEPPGRATKTASPVSRPQGLDDPHAAARRGRTGMLVALLSGALWGASAVVLGEALTRRPLVIAGALFAAPLAAAALHDTFAFVWVSTVNAAAGRLREAARGLRTRDGLVVCAAALIGGPLAMSTYLLAISFAGAPSAVAVSAVYPALGALLGYLVLGDRLGSRGWAGIVLAVAGATLASYAPPAGVSPPHYLLGALCAVASAAGWAIEGVLVARSLQRMPALAALNIREGVSALVFLVVVLPLFGAAALAARTVASPTIVILVLASLCGAGAYLLYYRALDVLGPARTMPANSTYVLWTIALSLVVTGDSPGWRLVLGGIVVVAGITLVAADGRAAQP
jgi:drug/metabolite transporter (DMT)-like permease